MADTVIPLRHSYPHRDIKFCLRSLEKHVKDLGRIIIVGDLPPFITGVDHIPASDLPGYQYASLNIFTKLKKAAEISNEFLVVHDDHFLLTDIVASEYPYYHRGPINPAGKSFGYSRLLENTLEQFSGANDFDVHCPIYMTRDGLSRLDQLDWSKQYGYGIKTAYCVLNGITGQSFTDCKIKIPLGRKEILGQLWGRTVFSTGSAAYLGDMERVLKELYPQKSSFENYK